MATLGGDTNQLLRKFMNRRRRKPTPADRTGKFPKPGQGENARFTSKSNDNPPHIYAPAVVPGYGDYVHEKAARKVRQSQAAHDRTTNSTHQAPYGPPPQRAPWRAGQRGPRRRTRPTPGSAYRNRRPTLN